VTDRLAEGWTPEQIAGRLKRGVERSLRYVSTETIYAWIFRPLMFVMSRIDRENFTPASLPAFFR
jgi:IS30 family transposase